MQLSKLIFGVFIVSLIISCNGRGRKLKSAVERAGENKGELLKVIKHYTKDPADSLKLEAAKYLIENMLGHYSYDSSQLNRYRPVVDRISLLRAKGLSNVEIKERVNPVMDSLVGIYPLSDIYSKAKDDLTSIKSELLINTIEQAFDSYDKNPFKDSIKSDDFLEYILPYRVQNGYCLEEWRPYFTKNYFLKDGHEIQSVHQYCDSLLFNFKDIKIGWLIADKFPYLKLKDYLQSKLTNCPQKCWFNCLLLRSFGIPVTIDFVPTCRVHEVGHEWNAIKLKNGTYPFEPFWDDIRYLKAIYGQKKAHPQYGPIQFPKVYRKTYKANISELLNYAINTGEEIPALFQNPFVKDVTNEYFKTFSLNTPISRNLNEAAYAYACVIGSNQTWIPVDYGKIRKGRISFRSLGPENVYLPSFYRYGNIIPADYPFLFTQEGNLIKFCPDTMNFRKIGISYVAYPRAELKEYKEAFIGGTIEGSNDKDFKKSEILYQIKELCEPGTYHIPLYSKYKYRYFRFAISKTKVKLNEVKFYNTKSGTENKLDGELICSSPNDKLLFKKVIDGDLITAAVLNSSNKLNSSDKIWIGYDFKVPVSINAFEFYFVFDANIRKEGVYELLYWDFGWKSLGIKKSEATNQISYDHVPENALLMIKIHDTDKYSRPFTYSNGEQHWW